MCFCRNRVGCVKYDGSSSFNTEINLCKYNLINTLYALISSQINC